MKISDVISPNEFREFSVVKCIFGNYSNEEYNDVLLFNMDDLTAVTGVYNKLTGIDITYIEIVPLDMITYRYSIDPKNFSSHPIDTMDRNKMLIVGIPDATLYDKFYPNNECTKFRYTLYDLFMESSDIMILFTDSSDYKQFEFGKSHGREKSAIDKDIFSRIYENSREITVHGDKKILIYMDGSDESEKIKEELSRRVNNES